MGYWIAALLLVAFGFITGFSIGPPFLLIGLAMLVLGPLRRWARLYWPPLGPASVREHSNGGEAISVKQLCNRRLSRRVRTIAPIVAAAVMLTGLAGCSSVPGASAPVATWPVSPEVLPPGTSGAPDPQFGRATWALDPSFAAPGPASTELHILVWELACSGGSPATGRMSAPVIAYTPTTVTITIGVRTLGGPQACPGPPGTPAIVQLAEPLGARTLLDGGRVPPAPPSPAFQSWPTPSAPALVVPAGAPPTSWSRVPDAPMLHVSPASNTAVATAPDGRFVAFASAIDSRKAPVILHWVDGLTWTADGSLPASGDTQVSAVARWGDLLVAVGEDTTAIRAAIDKGEATDARPAGAAWTSTDGMTLSFGS